MTPEAMHLDQKTDFTKFEFKTLDEVNKINAEAEKTEEKTPETTTTAAATEVKTETKTEEKPGETKTEEVKAEVKPIDDGELLKILNERGISLSKLDDIKLAMEEGVSLKAQVDTLSKQELKFPNDKAKALYEFAQKHQGNELGAAQNFLSAVRLDLDKADPKITQFEAFALQNPHLAREDAKAIFEEKYEKDYGDGNFDGKRLLQFEHDNATRSARLTIEDARKSYVEAKLPEPTKEQTPSGPSPEDLLAVKTGVDGALKDFNGATVTLAEYTSKTGLKAPAMAMNVAIKPEEAAKFRGFLENPDSFLHDVVGGFKGEKGMDWKSYANEMHQIVYRKEIINEAHSQGFEKGMAAMLEKIQNSGKEKTPDAGSTEKTPETWTQSYDRTRQPVN